MSLDREGMARGAPPKHAQQPREEEAYRAPALPSTFLLFTFLLSSLSSLPCLLGALLSSLSGSSPSCCSLPCSSLGRSSLTRSFTHHGEEEERLVPGSRDEEGADREDREERESQAWVSVATADAQMGQRSIAPVSEELIVLPPAEG